MALRHPRRYLVAVDGGESGQRAFDWAVENSTEDDVLTVGFVQSQEDDTVVYGMPGNLTLRAEISEKAMLAEWVADEGRTGDDRAMDVLTHYGRLCKQRNRTCELIKIETPTGSARYVGEALCSFMTEAGKDMNTLVLGSRDIGPLKKSLTGGSVGVYCLQHCPGVLVNVKGVGSR